MPRMTRKAERDAWTAHFTGEKAPTNKFNVGDKEKRGKYASIAEAQLAVKYQALEKGGHIRGLVEQHRIEILPADDVAGSITYVADFTYYDPDGTWHIIDCKGAKTQVYMVKKKLLWHIKKLRIEEITDGRRRSQKKRR